MATAKLWNSTLSAFEDVSSSAVPKSYDGSVFQDRDGKVYVGSEWEDAWSSLEIVPFSSGTDAQIKAMLDAYYNDELTWTEMGWDVGDTRIIHLNEMDAPSPQASGSKWSAQDITIVIVAHDHTDLATPINGHNKACITVETRECLNDASAENGQNSHIYVQGANINPMSFVKWGSLYLRTFINTNVYCAIPDGDFKSAIKQSKHYRHTGYTTSDAEQVTDTLFLSSYPEVFGTAPYRYYTATSPVEGTQFEYYATVANRVKYHNNDGISNGVAGTRWLGSTANRKDTNNYWLLCDKSGNANEYVGNYPFGLAPAWAM